MKRKLSKLTKSTFLVLSAKGIGIVSGLALNLIITREYGAKIMGEYSVFFSTVNLVTIFLHLGINTSLTKSLPVSLVNGISAIPLIRKFAEIIFWTNLIVLPFLFLFISNNVSFFVSDFDLPFGLLIIMALILRQARAFSVSGTRGLMMTKPFALEQASVHFLTLLALIAIYSFTSFHPILAYFFSLFINAVLFVLLFEWSARKKFSGFVSKQLRGSKEILHESLPMYVSALLQHLTIEGNVLILRFFQPLEDVSYFAVAARYAFAVNIILIAVRSFISPNLSKLKAAGEIDKLFGHAIKATKLITYIVIPVAIVLILATPNLFRYHGEGFEKCYIPFLIMLFGFLIKTLLGPVDNFLMMTGNHQEVAKINVITAVLYILLSMLLIPIYSFYGTAIVLAVTVILRNGLASFEIHKIYGRSISFFQNQIRN